MDSNAILSRLKEIGPEVQADLALVGRHAGYPWPTGPARLWGGYSYEIPKEEQIRSAFWSHLHDRRRLVCELEWNHYAEERHVPTAVGEIDLVGFDVAAGRQPPVLLLEFKRVWLLDGWLNKTLEMHDGICRDILKLKSVLDTLSSLGEPAPLAGVVVVAFSDNPARLAEPWNWKVWPGKQIEHELWGGTEVTCTAEIAEGKTRDVYSRADILVVTRNSAVPEMVTRRRSPVR